MINNEIKIELEKLFNKGRVSELSYTENLSYITFKNSSGKWEFKENKIDLCDCGEKSYYMVLIDDFMQIFECKKCLSYALQHYDECGFEDNEDCCLK